MNKTPALLDDYLDTVELAAELKRNPRTLIRWRDRKQGPPITYFGRKPLYRRGGVAAWLASREGKPR